MKDIDSNYEKDVSELIKLVEMSKELSCKILDENSLEDPKTKFRWLVTRDNLTSTLTNLKHYFGNKNEYSLRHF